MKVYKMIVCAIILIISINVDASSCEGKFLNPINICWSCLFPLTIGGNSVVKGNLPDTKNPTAPIGICSSGTGGTRVGLNIGYWEPFAIADVTDKPYCFVNLGGVKLDLGIKRGNGGFQSPLLTKRKSFFNVHWYKYPVIAWLNILTSLGCMQTGDFDIAYMTELDPSWNDSEMAFVLNPESVLFGNSIAQGACAADTAAVLSNNLPIDTLFWCAGSNGSMYPLSGELTHAQSPIDAGILAVERMDFKLHRLGMIKDSVPKNGSVCEESTELFMPKSRYRYEMVNQVVDGKHCYPFGYPAVTWESGHLKPNKAHQFGFLIWRKRNCTFL